MIKPNNINELPALLAASNSRSLGVPSEAPPEGVNGPPNTPTLAERFAAFRESSDSDDEDVDLGDRLARVAGPLALPPVGAFVLPDVDRDPMRRFLLECESARTAQTMQEGLSRIGTLLGAPAETIPWAQFRRPHVLDVKARLRSRYSPRTVNVTLAALRGVLRAAWELEQVSGDDYMRAVHVKNLKVKRQPKGRWLPDDDVGRVMAYARSMGPEARDWPGSAYGAFLEALFALLWGAGLRASEVASLPLGAYAGGVIRVIRKGDKEELVPIGDDVAAPLDRWVAVRAELDATGPALLPRIHESGAVGGRPLTRRTIERICKRTARIVGVASFSPHDFRRTLVTDCLDAGMDLATVQRLVGHESPATTTIYDRRPLKADAAARNKVNVMGRGTSKEKT